jgi:type IV pilus biogenesis protein CpaD/CtpE
MKLMNSENLLSNRARISALLLALMLLLLTGCSSTGPAETGALTESGSAEETTLPTVVTRRNEGGKNNRLFSAIIPTRLSRNNVTA